MATLREHGVVEHPFQIAMEKLERFFSEEDNLIGTFRFDKEASSLFWDECPSWADPLALVGKGTRPDANRKKDPLAKNEKGNKKSQARLQRKRDQVYCLTTIVSAVIRRWKMRGKSKREEGNKNIVFADLCGGTGHVALAVCHRHEDVDAVVIDQKERSIQILQERIRGTERIEQRGKANLSRYITWTTCTLITNLAAFCLFVAKFPFVLYNAQPL